MSTAQHILSDFNTADMPGASTFKFAIITADWNKEVTHALLEGAIQTLLTCGAKNEHIISTFVPGSFELTAAAALLASTTKYDAIICLGCVIQGETRHFEFISNAVANGISNVSIKYNLPVIFGVLTTDTITQALERAGGRLGNKGVEAAITAVKMADYKKKSGNGF